jgi:hypothetical protein
MIRYERQNLWSADLSDDFPKLLTRTLHRVNKLYCLPFLNSKESLYRRTAAALTPGIRTWQA